MLKQFSILLLICFSSIYVSAQTQQNEQATQGIAILSKPPTSYTERARTKGIEGTVRLRVTFLASGEIGDVVYVDKKSKRELKKYGLVDEAIKAAKLIKFEPAKKNGQPITVVKLVEYKFTIY